MIIFQRNMVGMRFKVWYVSVCGAKAAQGMFLIEVKISFALIQCEAVAKYY